MSFFAFKRGATHSVFVYLTISAVVAFIATGALVGAARATVVGSAPGIIAPVNSSTIYGQVSAVVSYGWTVVGSATTTKNYRFQLDYKKPTDALTWVSLFNYDYGNYNSTSNSSLLTPGSGLYRVRVKANFVNGSESPFSNYNYFNFSTATPPWQTRALALSVPNYQKSLDSTGMLTLKSDQFIIMLPNSANAEPFGKLKLYQLRLAYANTVQLLGRAPYALPSVIKIKYLLYQNSTGACCGTESDGYPMIYNVGTPAQYLNIIALNDPSTSYLNTADWSKIYGNHELTHRFMLGLNLSTFVDEGLAMYAQDRGQPQPMICAQGGYTQNSIATPYGWLCTNNANHLMQYYYTGDCFWQRAEGKYGLTTVKNIVGRLYNKTERDALMYHYVNGVKYVNWTSFSGQLLIDLNQAFASTVGTRFWQDFQDFGVTTTMANNKTFASENAWCAAT